MARIVHRVLTAALEKRLGDTNQATIGGAFGEVAEEYGRDLLQQAFAHSVHKLPEDGSEERADFVVAGIASWSWVRKGSRSLH